MKFDLLEHLLSEDGRRRRRRIRLLVLGAVLLLVAAVAVHLGWPRARQAMAHIGGLDRVESHREWILEAAAESRVDACLLAGVVFCESSGLVDAVSRVDALGLCQLMLPTAGDMARELGLPAPGRRDLLSDGQLNLRLGAAYLDWLSYRYDGHVEKVLIAYNAGPGRLDRWIEEAGGYAAWRSERQEAGDSDVLRYAAKVLLHRDRFRERGAIEPGP